MPRFFFYLHDGPNPSPDMYGDEFDSFEDARQHAQAILVDMAREEMPDGDSRHFACEVRDESGRVVYRGKLTYEGVRDPT